MENCSPRFADCQVQPSCPESEREVPGAMLLDVGVCRQLRKSLRAEGVAISLGGAAAIQGIANCLCDWHWLPGTDQTHWEEK